MTNPSTRIESTLGGWRTIESAPRDVRRCLLWCGDYATFKRQHETDEPIKMGRITEGRPYGDGMNGDWSFTHWMPLPPPPPGEQPSVIEQGPKLLGWGDGPEYQEWVGK